MFIKNISPNHVSLFHGGILIRRGEVTKVTKLEAESKEVSDAVRSGWISVTEGEPTSEPAAAPVIEITDPVAVQSMSAEEVAAEMAAAPVKKTRGAKPAETAETPAA